ncbi:di-heme oxidoredictase family protein [Flavobacterium sp. J372]|nr:di-heme oxidoredictase family protein [Flavobacterium sp. J372]
MAGPGSIEEAIQLHGGEAAGSRSRYNQLTQDEKQALIKFLNSL